MWYERIDTYLKTLGMIRSDNDLNHYYLGEGTNKTILVVYVDDLFITGPDDTKKTWLKAIATKGV